MVGISASAISSAGYMGGGGRITMIPSTFPSSIKASKQSVVDALPGMSAKIEEAIKTGNLNLKSESDIVKLVNTLNL